MSQGITIFSPATVANVGPGFDILGFAMNEPGDMISVSMINGNEHRIIDETGLGMPLDPARNVTSVAMDALLKKIGSEQKFSVTFHQKIPPGSGLGSSAASSAGGAFAANHLLGKIFSPAELVPFAMKGEAAASGSEHGDNVAPALMGGFVLIRSYHPLDVIRIPAPDSLFCTAIHPEIEIATEGSRKIMKTSITLEKAIIQWGNVAGLVSGLITGDMRLIKDSLHDEVAEPVRKFLIPEFDRVKAAALESGCLGSSISGSGPSVFALSDDRRIAKKAAAAMKMVFDAAGIKNKVYVSPINYQGIKILQYN